MPASNDHTVPILVLGAGPAGLALGAELRQRGVPFLIVEQGPAVGNSWRKMPSRLRLLSPWKANWLRPDDASRFSAHHETTRDEFAGYLRDFAAGHRLPLRTNVHVKTVRRDAGEGFIVESSDGELRARRVINATGCFSAPWTPEIPGANSSPLPRIHTAEFGDAESLRRRIPRDERPVLIVGKRLSAGQTMVELAEAGFQVALSCREPVEFGPGPLAWWLFFRLHPWLEARELRRRGADARGFMPRMLGGKSRQLVERGLVKIFPPIARFHESSVVFSDGRTLEPSAVIFATGFRPALRHLALLELQLNAETGFPELTGFESSEAPGLFFLGLDGQRSFQSRFIRGIRQDALLLAAELERRLTKPVSRSPDPRSDESLIEAAEGILRVT
jgi:putative flavoprotein involved in K+ transport